MSVIIKAVEKGSYACKCGLKAGDTLLVTGGHSGLASVIVRMAKAFDIRVITTVRGSKKADAISNLGADIIVDTTVENLSEVLNRELENGKGVDVVIDCLGGENMGKRLHYLNRGARWIMIASLAGQFTEIDLKNIYVRNVRIIGSTLRSRLPKAKANNESRRSTGFTLQKSKYRKGCFDYLIVKNYNFWY